MNKLALILLSVLTFSCGTDVKIISTGEKFNTYKDNLYSKGDTVICVYDGYRWNIDENWIYKDTIVSYTSYSYMRGVVQ